MTAVEPRWRSWLPRAGLWLVLVLCAILLAATLWLQTVGARSAVDAQPSADRSGTAAAPSAGDSQAAQPLDAAIAGYRQDLEALRRDAEGIRTQLQGHQTQLTAYQSQVDVLKWLVGIIGGLATLYAGVVALTSYYNARHLFEQMKEQSTQLKEQGDRVFGQMKEQSGRMEALVSRITEQSARIDGQSARIDAQSRRVDEITAELDDKQLALVALGKAVQQVRTRLNDLLPNTKEQEEYYSELTEDQRQEILLCERLVGLYAHAAHPAEAISEIYRGLGKFYNARVRHTIAGLPEVARRRRLDRLRDDLERARFYLRIAIRKHPGNFAAYNDLGVVLMDLAGVSGTDRKRLRAEAEGSFRRSLAIEPRQQRAHYNLARTLSERGEYRQAVDELTAALVEATWQGEADVARRRDIFYNRGCFQSRLGSAAGDGTLADAALLDVQEGCSPMTRETALTLLEDLKPAGDGRPEGDLWWLAQQRAAEMDALRVEAERMCARPAG